MHLVFCHDVIAGEVTLYDGGRAGGPAGVPYLPLPRFRNLLRTLGLAWSLARACLGYCYDPDRDPLCPVAGDVLNG